MSKSGQPATKTDTGGQRAPKSEGDRTESDKKEPKKAMRVKKGQAKKPLH